MTYTNLGHVRLACWILLCCGFLSCGKEQDRSEPEPERTWTAERNFFSGNNPGELGSLESVPIRKVDLGRERRNAVALAPQSPLTVSVHALGPVHFSMSAATLVNTEAAFVIRAVAEDGRAIDHEFNASELWKQFEFDLPPNFELTTLQCTVQGTVDLWIAEERLDRLSEAAPTVVLITSDTHRGDHIGAFDASGRVITPRLDALAQEGVYFTNCFSSTNVTNPSHFTLMTGLSLRETRVTNNSTALSSDAITLAEEFQRAGYRTFAAVSVMHLKPEQSNLHQGFDRYTAPFDKKRSGAATIDRIVDWIGDADGVPLFVWLHVYDAHAPYSPPERLIERHYKSAEDPKDPARSLGLHPDSFSSWVTRRKITNRDYVNALYAGEVDLVDELLGRVLDLERVANGVIAVTSDHGESLGDDGIWWDHTRLNHSTVHVPLILKWPGAETLRSDHPVEQIDIGKTLLEMAGIENSFPGRDLRSLAHGKVPATPRFSIGAHGWGAAVESGGWMLNLQIRPFFKAVGGRDWEHGETELYDLRSDPNAANNVLEGNFERAKRMRRALTDWLNGGSPGGLGFNIKLGENERRSLESLGYGGGSEGSKEGAFWEPIPTRDKWNKRFR